MAQTPAEYLSEIHHALALAQTNLNRAFSAVEKYEAAMGVKTVEKKHSIASLKTWQRWLADNGPASRGQITEASGVKLSERASPHTVVWDEVAGLDVNYPDDTVCRVRANPPDGGGRGAPPVIYFLWSQRYDVRDKYGVGPERPDPTTDDGPQPVDPAPAYGTVVYHPSDVAATVGMHEGLHGLADAVRPTYEPEPTVEPEPDGPTRFATVDEWNEHWAGEFKFLAQYGSKPTDEVRVQMVATLPEGVDPNGALAVAYSTAVRKANEATVLGVVQPPEVTADGDGSDLDWD